MAFDGNGTFNRTNGDNTGAALWQQDEADGDNIESSRHDTHDQDFADGLSNTICRDGQSTISANIPFNSKRLTGLGAATAKTDAIQATQVQNGAVVWAGTTGGTANAQTATLAPAITAYAAGQTFRFLVGTSNTGAATINLNSVGAVAIQNHGSACLGGELVAGDIAEIVFDGTQFQLITPFRPAYCSVTVNDTSNSSSIQFAILADGSYPGGAITTVANVAAKGIVYAAPAGTFTVNAKGRYKIDLLILLKATTTSGAAKIVCADDAGTFFEHDVGDIEPGTACVVSLSIIRETEAAYGFSFEVDGINALTVEPGTTVTITRVD